MQRHYSVILALVLLAYSASAMSTKLIFDTDMGNDVDDALALAMVHALQSRGEVELIAVTISKDHEETAPYVDAINTFYGRGNIPIGIVKGGVTPEKSRFTAVTQARVKRERVKRERVKREKVKKEQLNDPYVYPHDLTLGEPVRDANAVLREVLAAQPDKSVVIAQVGFSTNLSRLLTSGPDTHSPLNGVSLVRKKVKLISIMAGAFAPIQGETHLEYNIIQDIPAAQHLAKNWPTPIIWSGFEVGLAIRYPAVSIERDFRYRKRHPIRESYQAYVPTPHERPTWDLTSVLHVARHDRGYFGISDPGTVTVHDDGKTTFEPEPQGRHQFLTLAKESIRRLQEIFAALASEPPH